MTMCLFEVVVYYFSNDIFYDNFKKISILWYFYNKRDVKKNLKS